MSVTSGKLTMSYNHPLCLESKLFHHPEDNPKPVHHSPLFRLEKEMPTHSSTLAWRIPWTEEPGGL